MSYKGYIKIKSIPKYVIFLCLYFFLYPLCKLFFGRKSHWLICERGNEAQDNGFVFFKYLVENHPEIKPVYLLRKTSKDYEKVAKIGKVVEFGSIKHFMMAIGCPTKISSHLFGYAPWVQMTTYFRRNTTHDRHIFLQHGIIKNLHEGLFGDVCKSLDLFVCGAKPEYDFVLSNFHYRDGVPLYTGLARYDLLDNHTTKNQLLFMPTWRTKLAMVDTDCFLKSDFYKEWNKLVNNSLLLETCKNHNLNIKFYLHYSLQNYSKLFKGNDVVKVIGFGEEEVQDLLKDSKLLITDFSSVFFDFGYMNKPVVYFQFDEDTFYDEHYSKGYFDYRRDGFGDVTLNADDAVKSILGLINNNFKPRNDYLERMSSNFVYRDNKNCERIYNAILWGRKNDK